VTEYLPHPTVVDIKLRLIPKTTTSEASEQMKVLVTGGAGFIGSHILERLVQLGSSTVAVDDLSNGSKKNIPSGVVCYEVGITDRRLAEIFDRERPDAVVHQAAQVSVGKSFVHPSIDADTNIMGTLNILQCCRDYNVKRIVYASSCAVYGNPQFLPVTEDHPLNPMSMYAASKATAESYVHLHHQMFGLQYAILRYANVYGPRQTLDSDGAVVPTFIATMLHRESPIIYGNGRQTRDFIHVRDVADANVAALQATESGVFNISSGSSIEVLTLYEMLKDITQCDVGIQFEPAQHGDILHSELNDHRARSVLKWTPSHSLKHGLRETVSYYKKSLQLQ
jgi:UDP-glucose 4-epimerase